MDSAPGSDMSMEDSPAPQQELQDPTTAATSESASQEQQESTAREEATAPAIAEQEPSANAESSTVQQAEDASDSLQQQQKEEEASMTAADGLVAAEDGAAEAASAPAEETPGNPADASMETSNEPQAADDLPASTTAIKVDADQASSADIPGIAASTSAPSGDGALADASMTDDDKSNVLSGASEVADPTEDAPSAAAAAVETQASAPIVTLAPPTGSPSPYPSQASTPVPSFTNPPLALPTAGSGPNPSSSGTPSSSKVSPLALDPSIAKATAAQLLERKQQVSGSMMTRIAKIKQRIERNKYDGDAWIELLHDVINKGDLERSRETFEGFLRNFPDNAREWIAYADLELSHGNNDRVNEIFGRCLRSSPSVQLWHFYLTYIRRTNPIDRSSPERALPARDVITKAFEFSLAHVGADLDAGTIWYDYIEFLKEAEVSGTWEAQQKMDKLRQTYQRAVCIPLANVEQIWRDYDAFENSLNRATARKFLQDRSPAYMTARAAARQLQQYFSRLNRVDVPYQPNWNSSRDREQIEVWKNIISYEEKDPLELADTAAIRTRVLLAFRKAISQLRFYPEIWYMAATYARKVERLDEAAAFWRAGMAANPTSLLVHYGYAEAEEAKGNFEECHKVYSGLVERLTAQVDSTNAAAQQEVADALDEKAKVEAQERQAKAQNGMLRDEADEVGEDVRMQERESIRKAILDSKSEQVEELKRLGANVWIMHMRFARRAEGIQAARTVFSRARKWPHITWQTFEASAMLELHWNKEPKIATNVFEVGLKRFGDEVGFVVRYLDFLITINDDGNARAVFERAIAKVPAEKARSLWRRWAEYEYLFGDLAGIQKLDGRLAEAYPEDPPIDRFTDRHTYLDLDDMAYKELGRDVDDRSGPSKRDESTPTPAPPQQQMGGPGMPGMGGMAMPPAMPPQHMMPPPGAMMGQQQQQPNMPMPPQMQQQQQQQPDPWGRGRDFSPARGGGPGSVDGDDRRRTSGRFGGGPPSGSGMPMNNGPSSMNKRRRSPSPPARGRATKGRNSPPPRISRHTPPDDFPEAIPWLMSLLPSKTVFAAHGPILDAQHLFHILQTIDLPRMPGGDRPPMTNMGGGGGGARDRSRSPQRRMGGPGPRRRSPDYSMRRR